MKDESRFRFSTTGRCAFSSPTANPSTVWRRITPGRYRTGCNCQPGITRMAFTLMRTRRRRYGGGNAWITDWPSESCYIKPSERSTFPRKLGMPVHLRAYEIEKSHGAPRLLPATRDPPPEITKARSQGH